MTRRKANILFLPLLLAPFLSNSQHRHAAALEPVKTNGFYQININPDLSRYLRPDLGDIRIVDEKNRPVPYIIQTAGKHSVDKPVYEKLRIESHQTVDAKTVLVINNSQKKYISNFAILLRSASAERTASLTGSDDNWDWFVVLDSLLISNPVDNTDSAYYQYIKFPPSGYSHYMLTINNGKRAPLNITDVYTVSQLPAGAVPDDYQQNPPVQFTQVDTGSFSVITIFPGQPFHINQIQLEEGGSYLFQRQARLYSSIDSNINRTWDRTPIHSFVISSDDTGTEILSPVKNDTLFLIIRNGDNPPLTITGVSTGQLKRSLVAQLESGMSYRLLLNDPLATAPKYDLEEFKSRIPDSIVLVGVLPVKGLAVDSFTQPEKKMARWWIWPVLAFVIGMLLLLTGKLITDMRKDSNKNRGV